MQKWEYLNVNRTRGFSAQSKKALYLIGGDWNYWIWPKGAKEGKKWEGDLITDLFCELGDQGWELVTASPRSSYCGYYESGGAVNANGDFAGFTDMEVFMFKRPKE